MNSFDYARIQKMTRVNPADYSREDITFIVDEAARLAERFHPGSIGHPYDLENLTADDLYSRASLVMKEHLAAGGCFSIGSGGNPCVICANLATAIHGAGK